MYLTLKCDSKYVFWIMKEEMGDGLDPSRMGQRYLEGFESSSPSVGVRGCEDGGLMLAGINYVIWPPNKAVLSAAKGNVVSRTGYDSLHALCWPDHVFQKWHEVLGQFLGGTEVNWSLFVRNRERDQIHVMHSRKRLPALQPGFEKVSRWQAP